VIFQRFGSESVAHGKAHSTEFDIVVKTVTAASGKVIVVQTVSAESGKVVERSPEDDWTLVAPKVRKVETGDWYC
jgi:hypothetical protein